MDQLIFATHNAHKADEVKAIVGNLFEVKNLSDTDINLCKLSSLCLDLPCGKWKQKHFYGRHTMERIEESIDLPHGITAIGSRRGTSSH